MKFLKAKNNVPYTPIIEYRKDDTNITLVGTIHVASADYYNTLQKEIDSHPIGFYEGIREAKKNAEIPKEKEQYLALQESVTEGYRLMAEMCDLQYESDALIYGKQWKKKDLRLDELINESSIETLHSLSQMENDMNKMKMAYKHYSMNPVTMMRKQGIISLVNNQDSDTYGLGEDEQRVIIDMRNEKIYQALESELGKGDHDKIGITYGAGHAKGIDEYIRSKGFKRENVLWVPVWEDNNAQVIDKLI